VESLCKAKALLPYLVGSRQGKATKRHPNMSTLLVTGGAGSIGCNTVEELLKRGENVRMIDGFSAGRSHH
jgi:FlaA1/EpsC-like NDP-sugar epimerase